MGSRNARLCRPLRRLLRAAVTILLALTAAPGVVHASASPVDESIIVNGHSAGARFGGVGGLSAGASSRLLYDYPEPQRAQLLDYLFKPGYGASLQVLKTEIGGDTNSTAGAEASHSRGRGRINCSLGYEWWLMREAQKRNPDIRLAGLQWGAPGYFRGGFWSRDNIDYIQSWLGCAERHGLHIDYVGGWNESGYDKQWFQELDRALAVSHPEVRIVAADEYESWSVARALRRDPEFARSVDTVGSHDPCDARTLYRHCPSSRSARALHKPLWDSETSAEAHDVGAGPLARSLNRDYLDGRMTTHVYWSPISAWYPDLPVADTGLMLAEWPWSGHYRIGPSTWSLAHTAQFTKPGWRYLDEGSGYLDNGASHVSLRSPVTGDYATVVETMDATGPTTVRLSVGGGLSTGTVHAWASDLSSSQRSDDFVHVRDIEPVDGTYRVTLQPGHLYTFATTNGHKGDARPSSGIDEQLPVPFQENFEGHQPHQLARFFSDVDGGFQTEPCRAGRTGMCYEQKVSRPPIEWNDMGATPSTVVGDPRWWGDYQVSTDAMLPEAGQVEVWGRVESEQPGAVSGYRLRVGSNGTWRLVTQQARMPSSRSVQPALDGRRPSCSGCAAGPPVAETELASGRVPFTVDKWHRVALRFRGDLSTVLIDGREVATVRDDEHTVGQAGLAVNGWQRAQFDNFTVTPTAPPPHFLPQSEITATASSAHRGNYEGYTFGPERAVDDRPETLWHSEFSPPAPLPQSITLDLADTREVTGLAYRPRLDEVSGRITRYNAYVSDDGKTFTKVAAGTWPTGTATRLITWPARSARYVRLEAVEGTGGLASAAELRIAAR